MKSEEIKRILAGLMNIQTEVEWVEFKEARTNYHFDDLGKYFSALSNEANLKGKDCGWLILGVTDKPPRNIVGTQYRPTQVSLESLKKEVADHTTNRISFDDIYELSLPEGRVLMFQIPPALKGIPTAWKGHYYGRDGESLVALNPREYEHIRGQAIKEDWSAKICAGAAIADLDPEAIKFARDQYKKKHARLSEEVDQWDDLTFLNKAKVCISGQITNTAIILLGKEESEHLLIPSLARIMWVLKDASGMEMDYDHFGPPLLLKVDQILAKIRNLTIRYLPSGTLFPLEITQYDSWVIRETLHNCIAHQDYTQAGRINVVETPDSLLFTNLGTFIPGSIEEVLRRDAPPEQYRNPFLAKAMVELNMIDTIGSGIKRMFTMQKQRFFPMPDYDLSDTGRIRVRLLGKVIDENYTQLLIQKTDLLLMDAIALDKVQKRSPLTDEEFKRLKDLKLVEGRRPNLYVSAKIAALTGGKAAYIRHRTLDKDHYKKLIIVYLEKFGEAKRSDFEEFLMDKISDVLSKKEKINRIRNLLFEMSHKDKTIVATGPKKSAVWRLNKQ